MRYKVIINWYGEILTFYTKATSEEIALSNAIIQCAKKVGWSRWSVRNYIKDENYRRWEVIK